MTICPEANRGRFQRPKIKTHEKLLIELKLMLSHNAHGFEKLHGKLHFLVVTKNSVDKVIKPHM